MHYVCVAWTCSNTPGLSFGVKQKIISGVLTVLLAVFFILPHHFVGLISLLMLITGYMWFGIVYIYFMFVMLALAVQLIFKIAKKSINKKFSYFVIGAAALVVVFAVYSAFKAPSLTELEVVNNIRGTHNMKIVFITDTHFGGTVGVSRAKRLTQQVNALEPDFILFGGDIFEDTEDYIAEFVQAVKEMKAKKGKFGVPGNHEYYDGVVKSMDLFRKADIVPLQNTGKNIGPVTVLGVNDIVSSKISKDYFSKTVKNYSRITGFNILLSHTPLYFEEAAKNGANLMLSGHTHNGQIWPFKYFVRLRFKYLNGLYKYDNSELYVSSGTFYWGPALRLFTKNELVLITLKEENPPQEDSDEEFEEEFEEPEAEPVKRVPVSYDDIVGEPVKKKEEPKAEPKEVNVPVDLPLPQTPSVAPLEESEELQDEEEVNYDIQIVFEEPKKEKEPDPTIDKWPEADENFIPWSDVFQEPQADDVKKAKKEESKPAKVKEEKTAVKETENNGTVPAEAEETEEFSDILILDDVPENKKEEKSVKAAKKTAVKEDSGQQAAAQEPASEQQSSAEQSGKEEQKSVKEDDSSAATGEPKDKKDKKEKKNKKEKKKKSKDKKVKENTDTQAGKEQNAEPQNRQSAAETEQEPLDTEKAAETEKK